MTGISITTLPPLPNPASHRHPQSSDESLRILNQLNEGASSGNVEYPYPQTHEYPLPPLPPIPVPAGTRRRGVSPKKREVDPIQPEPKVDASSLASAVEGHGTLHFNDSALLLQHEKGWTWALLSRGGENGRADEVRVLGVRFFPARDKRPPPIHALPPAGVGQVISDHLMRLRLNLPSFLERLPAVLGLLDQPCYRCRRFLSDGGGLPLCTGWLRKERDKAKEREKEREKEKEKEAEKEKEKGAQEGDKMEVDEDAEAEGKWVAWHASCKA